ncbi:unnamed protein product [Thelazia callipaeda]|uniref:ATP-binding cassette sub-family C member 7 n=1 Tax=Thelazia callipaeda TaxID=103827 RepID=A0A158RC36_THECL|nr:unnamed protein product [Thelazia callipaeda]
MYGKFPVLRKNIESVACFLLRYSFLFITPTLMRGYREQLKHSDLFEPLPEHDSETATRQMTLTNSCRAWEKEKLMAAKANRKPSMVKVVRRLYAKRFSLLGVLIFIKNIFQLLQPVSLGLLIRYFRYDSPLSKRDAYLAATGVAITSIMIPVIHHPYFYSLLKLGMELKIASCGMVMEKTFLYLHHFWLAPLLIIVYIYLLWHELGLASLAGFVALLLLIPFQSHFSRRMGRCRLFTLFELYLREIVMRADKRVSATNEILNGIRVIKMYTWEDVFSNLINRLRRYELSKVQENCIWQSLVLGLFWVSSKFIILFAILCYLLAGYHLSAERVFVAAALYNSSVLPITLFLPFAFQSLFETRISLSRLQEFLELDEYDQIDYFGTDMIIKSNIASDDVAGEKVCVSIQCCFHSLLMDKDAVKEGSAVLRDISLMVQEGELVVVTGPVGSGKTSLLLSILRETNRTWGVLRTIGRIAYVPQEAWIFPGTVRDNILFGLPYVKKRYDKVTDICALKKDFSQFPSGDEFSVGDRGQSLSGGQKARISLARAIYQDADIYLLDDPLSAVDAAVGRSIFNRCIKQFLKSKAVLLVTHQIQYVQNTDLVVLMLSGKIVASGTMEDLKDTEIFNTIVRETEKSLSLLRTGLEETTDIYSFLNDDVLQKSDDEFNPNLNVNVDASFSKRSHCQVTSIDYSKSIDCKIYGQRLEVGNFFTEEENCTQGAVPWRIYFLYLKAMAHPWFLTLLMAFFAVAVQILENFIDWWLNKWTDAAENATKQVSISADEQITYVEYVDNLKLGPFNIKETLSGYRNTFSLMIGVLVIASIVRVMWFRLTQVTASRVLHDLMFQRVLKTTISFFDKNPTGRILNRFSKDIATLDDQLSFAFFDFSLGMMTFFGYIIVIVIINPFVLLITGPLILLFIFLRCFYLSSSRSVKRLEATTRSPLYSHVSSAMYGLVSVRAFRNQQYVVNGFHKYQNVNTAAFYFNLCIARWFGAVIDWLVAIFITAVAFLCIASTTKLTGGEVGLVLVYAVQLLGHFSWILRQSAELQNAMISVERIIDYSKLPQEPIREGVSLPLDWPSEGHIVFKNVTVHYGKDAPPVLKNINADIIPMEKIGIVGRTGAGKSSLLKAIFHLIELEGSIIIDNIDTKTVSLKSLRQRISIIPQDPVLFMGTLMQNLNPFNEHSKDDVWHVLEQVELKDTILDLPSKLETEVEEGGTNFSVGQRQLICLARALLRRSKILVIDEATANVDPMQILFRTDSFIQRTIKRCFRNSTVLTIAHRLHTIMDSDRVMVCFFYVDDLKVLDNGKLIEFDHPYSLLCKEKSALAALAAETGEHNLEYLKRLAMHDSENEVEKRE